MEPVSDKGFAAMSIEVHLEGLGFPEGPAVLPDGSVAFVDLLHRNVRRYKDGSVQVIAKIEGSPNGMRLGPDGHLYVTNNGGIAPESGHSIRLMNPQVSGRIQRIHLSGRVDDVVVNLPGAGPWRPNDLIFSPEGKIVFTDPQNWECIKDWTATGRIPDYRGGQLFLASLSGEASLLVDVYGFPNGLAFHPDGSLLIAMSLKNNILKFPWHRDRLGKGELWCQFEDGTSPDGILVHGEQVYVAGSVGDKVSVVDLNGRLIRAIDTGVGSDPTNLAMGYGQLWVTLGNPGKLISIDL
jgi:sugar lactone lactonase YvrE